MTTFSHVPPGFRFHPTDEELVDYYLRKKVNSRRIDLDVIKDVDLYKIEPWDLQELCRLGLEDQDEWYFFSHKDKKYPTGSRTNRATSAGFWKATGRDKAIYSKHDLVGMRKTLVFYIGRAPNGQKSDWIMHEYRLETDENATTQEEGWVVCRAFKKRIATTTKVNDHESLIWYNDHHQVSFMPEMDSPPFRNSHSYSDMGNNSHYPYANSCKIDLDDHFHNYQISADHFFQLPLLVSSKMPPCNTSMPKYDLNINHRTTLFQSPSIAEDQRHFNDQAVDQVRDWRVLDKFVASQLSQEDVDVSKENRDYSSNADKTFHGDDFSSLLSLGNISKEDASTSISSCQIDQWK